MRRLGSILLAILALFASVASAQQKLGPADGIRFNWPAPNVSADGLNTPDGFRVKAVSPSDTGVVIKTWTIADPAARSFTVTAAEVPPSGLFSISVHPYNVAGEAGASNIIGPFGRAAVPTSLTGVTGSVVADGGASLRRPESGDVAESTWTRSSTLSTTTTSAIDSALMRCFPMDDGEAWKCSFPVENLSGSESLTSSLRAKLISLTSMLESR